MSISALRAITMARPGIETRGVVATPRDIEKVIIKEMGARKVLGSLGILNKVPVLRNIPGLGYAKTIRDFLRHLSENIDASGISQKFVADLSIMDDPDSVSLKIPYDPAVDMGAVAIKKLLSETKVDPNDIGSLYVACTTFNSADPPIVDRILAKLARDKIVPKKVLEGDERNASSGWSTKMIAEGCVGWIKLVEEVERDMQLNQFVNGRKSKYAIGVAIAVNTMHMRGNNPHEIIAYGDGAAAGLFVPSADNSGPFIIGPTRKIISEADRVVHQFMETKGLSMGERVRRYFSSNYVSSKKVAHTISDGIPQYLTSFLDGSGFNVTDLDHIIISQTSKGVLDKTIIVLSEQFIKDENLPLDPNDLRKALERIIEYKCKVDISNSSSNKRRSILCNYLLKAIESNNGGKIYEFLNDNEKKLFEYMLLLYSSIYRVYDKHGYTGVASIPMAIAQGVEDHKISLDNQMALIGSGLGINIQGLLSKGAVYPVRKPLSNSELVILNNHRQTVPL